MNKTYRILLETHRYVRRATYKCVTQVEFVTATCLSEAAEKAIKQTTLKPGVSPIVMSMGWPVV